MSDVNIFRLAEENSGHLENAWEEALRQLPESAQDKARRFFTVVREKGRIAINVKQENLWRFVQEGVYLNVHQVARKRAEQNGSKVEDELRTMLKEKWFDKRIAFDYYFRGGDEFKYGSLNIGGLGAIRYKDHCLVLKTDPGRRAAYLRNDSLRGEHYWGPGDSFEPEAATADLADEDHKPHLAGLKHGAGAVEIAQAKWPELLCNARDYIETIFTGELAVDGLEAVRMPKKRHDELFGYVLDLEADGLTDDLGLRVQTFMDILEALDQNGVALELVDA